MTSRAMDAVLEIVSCSQQVRKVIKEKRKTKKEKEEKGRGLD
jgi:hypothetical protein